jgi:hypothetical protein
MVGNDEADTREQCNAENFHFGKGRIPKRFGKNENGVNRR